jgi:hypothetical protein
MQQWQLHTFPEPPGSPETQAALSLNNHWVSTLAAREIHFQISPHASTPVMLLCVSQEEYFKQLELSSTLYIGNLSFYTSEDQVGTCHMTCVSHDTCTM